MDVALSKNSELAASHIQKKTYDDKDNTAGA